MSLRPIDDEYDYCDGCGYHWSTLNDLGHEVRDDGDCGPPNAVWAE